MDTQKFWESIYDRKESDQVSWFSPHLKSSISLIEHATGERTASLIDVGAGESTLIDDLLARGYRDISVIDIAKNAIEHLKRRLGAAANGVRYIVANVTEADLAAHSYDVWHDRALFHFLTTAAQRRAYVHQVLKAIKPGGHVIIGTFGPDGPKKCSGLDVNRYDSESLHYEFGQQFRLIESFPELHYTPTGIMQQFLYCHFVLDATNTGPSGAIDPQTPDP